MWGAPRASGGNHRGTGSSRKLSLSPNRRAPVILQVGSALAHHQLRVPLEPSSPERVPVTPPSAASALEDSSTTGLARVPAFPVVRRPPSQRRARTHASAWVLAACSRYVLWQWDPRTRCISKTGFGQVQLRCNLTRLSSGFQVTRG